MDCEYNSDGIDPKRIRSIGGTSDNYLAIEMKKATSTVARDVDYAKDSGYKRDLKYSFAPFIELRAGGQSGIEGVEWV